MKFTKKNAFAIGAAVMMTAALATFASASTPTSASTPASGSIPVITNEDSVWVEAVDVDLSAIDWSSIREGELVATGTVDPAVVNGGATTAGKDAIPEAAVYAVDADVDMSAIVQAGEPVAIGTIDPAAVNGGGTTQAKPAE